jgi:hypothetical protein
MDNDRVWEDNNSMSTFLVCAAIAAALGVVAFVSAWRNRPPVEPGPYHRNQRGRSDDFE